MLVKDVTQIQVVSIDPDATLLEAAEMMLGQNVDTLLVSREDQLLGVVGLRDLFTAPIPAHYGNSMLHRDREDELLNTWRTTPVRNLMNERVLSVNENMTLLRALELMVNSGKHPLPVLREGKVVGVISRIDIVRALVGQQSRSA